MPISDILPGLEGLQEHKPLLPSKPKAQRSVGQAVTVQSRHHYTRMKQVMDLARIGDVGSQDMGFMARLLTLCSLPRTDPGEKLQFKRQNGPFKLILVAGGDNKLPFGNIPRLLLAWVCTEAVRTKSRDLVLGKSLAVFMRDLGIKSDSGGSRGDRTRLKSQIDRLFHCQIQLIYEADGHKKTPKPTLIADESEFWWDHNKPEQDTLWESTIQLSELLFEEIMSHPIPLNKDILKHIRRSSLGLDLYMWLSYKTFTLYRQGKKPERLAWEQLYRQFGSDPGLATDKNTVQNFRRDVLREIAKLKLSWPALDVRSVTGALEVRGCEPSITPKALKGN